MKQLQDKLTEIVGRENVLLPAVCRERKRMWETNQPFNAKALVRPANTEEVAAVMRLCHENHQSVVPYGGVTNLVQACATGAEDIVLSLEKMAQIEETDASAMTMTAQAGVTMRQAQEAADRNGMFFPVDIGARDACQVGGFVSTNAGGTKVIRYGMTRDSVLGLEVVLANGTVLSSMNRYVKNNSGFDLKQLFIGSEGVLGIITRVVFRLSVKSTTHNVALVACNSFDDIVQVLDRTRNQIGEALSGFEVMWDSFYRKATKPGGRQDNPFEARYPVYAIIESMGNNPSVDDDLFMNALESLLEDELIQDAVVAKSDRERESLWAIRGEVEWLVAEAQNFDVSLRSSDVAAYQKEVDKRISGEFPNAHVAFFGHLGDNNLHVSVLQDSKTLRDQRRVEQHIYESLLPFHGAISAEHGIGLEKREYLPVSRSAAEIALMKSLKATLDPRNILNPGKVLGDLA